MMVAAALAGCASDYRAQVATALIVKTPDASPDRTQDRGGHPGYAFDERAFAAALLASFPVNSPTEKLKRFVISLRGDCYTRDKQNLTCKIPLEEGFCYSNDIGIEVSTADNAIAGLRTYLSFPGCFG